MLLEFYKHLYLKLFAHFTLLLDICFFLKSAVPILISLYYPQYLKKTKQSKTNIHRTLVEKEKDQTCCLVTNER